jgi:hypothetical protein
MLKTKEKLVDRYIKHEILGPHPLHQHQFAYQPGKSTETALHYVIAHIEAAENKEMTLGAFLDTERTFDSTSHNINRSCQTVWVSRHNLSVDQLHSGQEENHNHTCRRKSGGSLWLGAFDRAAFYCPCCGAWLLTNSQRDRWEWLLHTGVCRWQCYPNQWKISIYCLKATSGHLEYGTTVVWQNSVIYQPTKDSDSSILQGTDIEGA